MTDPTDDSGLLGKVPRHRPGVASPRRAAAREAAARRSHRPAAGDAATDTAPREAGETSGFEQLARAGVGLATGVAGAGFRLAGRAAGELGKVVGRR